MFVGEVDALVGEEGNLNVPQLKIQPGARAHSVHFPASCRESLGSFPTLWVIHCLLSTSKFWQFALTISGVSQAGAGSAMGLRHCDRLRGKG